MDRRSLMSAMVALALPTGAPAAAEESRTDTRPRQKRIKAVAFDGFPIIDPRPIAARVEELFPGKADKLFSAWRTRQFEYTWLRTLSGHYVDFWQTTEDALIFAAQSEGVALSDESRQRLMATYLELKVWSDAPAALESLRSAGIRVAFLSNFTTRMLDAASANSRLQGVFEPHLSTDRVRVFKPHPRAYDMGLRAFGLTREEIVFCAAAGWDAAGAKWFGYPTFWVNRSGAPVEALGVRPDGVGSSMADLAQFVLTNS